MRSFREIVKDREEEREKSLQKIWRKQYIFDKDLVNNIVQIGNNTSIENIINRFESIDRKYEMISFEEALLEKQDKNFIEESQLQLFSMEAGIPYLNYMEKGGYDWEHSSGAKGVANGIRALFEYYANGIIAIINIIIKIINVAIQFVLNIVQFIATQFFKLLANQKIPRNEFEEKMSKLSANSFKKKLKTRYPVNTGELIIKGIRNFSVWGRMTEEKSKWLVNQYQDMLNKSNLDFGDFDVTTFNSKQFESKAAIVMDPYAVELHKGLIGSLQKDFLEKSISSYRDSFYGKLVRAGFERQYRDGSGADNPVLKLRQYDNNVLQEMAKEIVKVIFGKKKTSEEVDVLEFFRNNAEILTDDKNEELKKFIDVCKKSVQHYKVFSKEIRNLGYKYDLKNLNADDHPIKEKINKLFLYKFYQKLLLPYTRVSCSLINFVRRGFVLEYYKFKRFVFLLWKKADFSGEDEEALDAEIVTDDDATPQEILRIGVIE